MEKKDEKRKAAAKCENCGTIGSVYVWPDGEVSWIGGEKYYSCETYYLRVIKPI